MRLWWTADNDDGHDDDNDHDGDAGYVFSKTYSKGKH